MEISQSMVWAEVTRTSAFILLDILISALRAEIDTISIFVVVLLTAVYLRGRINAYLYLFIGPKKIEAAYAKAKGYPFTITAPDHKVTFVSSPQHANEIDTASPDVLSLFAASKQMFQPQYTMHGFEWVNRRGQDGIGFVRTLRVLLTSYVPKMIPGLRSVIETQIMNHSKFRSDGVRELNAFEAIKRTIVTAAGFSFFGQDILPNQLFMNAAYENIEHVMRASEAIRIMPKFLAPFLGKLFCSSSKVQEIWYNTLQENIQHRLEAQSSKNNGSSSAEGPQDIVQWVIETAPKEQNWSSGRLTHEVIALWFGSIHGLSISTTFALFALCNHPEYIKPLREELQSEEWTKFIETSNGLPLLDSFIKESMRMQPMDYMTSRRVALKPFHLSGDVHIKAGDWICMPLKNLLSDPRHYPSPDRFEGFRFARTDIQPEGPSKLTDVSYKWGVWGNRRQACPARFFASVIIKLTMAHILMNFEVELKGKNTKVVNSSWRSYNFPRKDLVMSLKPRID
ncbi:cytochrome P450 [Corynespora cassiicola Philippines]|uniref:Cytochrome P450 n=1 Tax=Corynespora cassiicola Philippines TaxID=1448308 RepID=A0A2T2NX89_CORCC|nr:cytochrome P450 [Corynespora cassiicola Philippines]